MTAACPQHGGYVAGTTCLGCAEDASDEPVVFHPADSGGVSVWPWFTNRADCPAAAEHREPEGPCEDIAQCGSCGAISFSLRPVGETFGFHAPDCSLPMQHERYCVGGGAGHPPGKVRGWWRGFEADVEAERRRFTNPTEGQPAAPKAGDEYCEACGGPCRDES